MIATLLAPPASEADGRRRFRLEIPAGSPLFAGHFPGEPILPGIAHPALVAEALTAAGETLPEIAEIVSLKLRRPVRPGDRLDLLADGPTTDGTVRFEIRLSSQDQEGATVSLGALRTATARSGEGLRPAIAPEAAPGFPPVATLLPHQPPARLVRSIRAVTAESFAGLAEIPAASPFVHQGRAPAYLGIEAAAQGAAVLEALARCASPRPHRPQIGYLVGIRNGRCRGAWLPAGVPFPIAVELTGSAPPLSIYTLRVAAEDGGELVAGTIQTYLAASP